MPLSNALASSLRRQPGARVHVLGLGSIGTFAAHALAEIPAPLRPASVTLLLHRASLVEPLLAGGRAISLQTRHGSLVRHAGYRFEMLDGANRWLRDPLDSAPGLADEAIQNLVVSVKATQTVAALRPLRHRLTWASNILFLQNGSGMLDDVNRELFANELERPNYIVGVVSHGVTLRSPFDIVHTGSGATWLGPVPSPSLPSSPSSSRRSSYLVDALPLAPRLKATSLPYRDVFQAQLEKLALNAFCNPLCALANAKNRYLCSIPHTKRALLSEISAVARALPELRHVPGVVSRFSLARLEQTVDAIVGQTLETTCSMVVDLRRGRRTEIDYINGYWTRRGREVGVPTPLNDALVEQIRARQRLAALDLSDLAVAQATTGNHGFIPELPSAATSFAVANGS
ncbi:hypothetical protein CDD82_1744 [Ophiocordyceps australis]|uniref:2-dehydropantoate 2-reductase n=1 Tax=Ophiocordyceps australis TaxID=1399860 RepID=A0A2C5ZET5_9HYPO|nr:hypothetical protein CDD82_1744 [Ophiocordyceps australis]